MISLLDEECTFPRASDITLANKLKEHLKGNLCFRGERERTFRICHYAGEVCSYLHIVAFTVAIFFAPDKCSLNILTLPFFYVQKSFLSAIGCAFVEVGHCQLNFVSRPYVLH